MTGHVGNSEFCFPETRNIEVERKQNSLFHAEPAIKCFVIPSNSKLEKTAKKSFPQHRLAHKICRGFKKHDLITRELKINVVVSLGVSEFSPTARDTFSSNR